MVSSWLETCSVVGTHMNDNEHLEFIGSDSQYALCLIMIWPVLLKRKEVDDTTEQVRRREYRQRQLISALRSPSVILRAPHQDPSHIPLAFIAYKT